MVANDVIALVRNSTSIDEYGDMKNVDISRNVFARLGSIGQKEFYQANAVGLKPEIKFILADYLDYDDEPFVDYTPPGKQKAQRYRVLRTFRSGQELEITCYREVNPA
ncbi:MAG: hypothetical protein PUF71_02910 [Firmicutes bacterium]|nr:hypothetical protein [Bacillota bacterium]